MVIGNFLSMNSGESLTGTAGSAGSIIPKLCKEVRKVLSVMSWTIATALLAETYLLLQMILALDQHQCLSCSIWRSKHVDWGLESSSIARLRFAPILSAPFPGS